MKKALNFKKNKYKINVYQVPLRSPRAHILQSKMSKGDVLDAQDRDAHFTEQNVNIEAPVREQDCGSFFSFKEKLDRVAEKEVDLFFPKKKNLKISTVGENLVLREREKRKVHHQLLQLEGFSSHFGRKSRHLDFAFPWHASMSNKFSGVRNKVPHVDSEQTLQSLVEAFYSIALVLRKGGKVLIVNKNGEFSSLFHTNNLNVKPSLRPQDGGRLFASQRGVVESMETTRLHFGNPSYQAGSQENVSKEGAPLPSKSKKGFGVFLPCKKTNTESKRNPFLHSFVESENFLRKCGEYRNQCRPATAPFKWVGGCLTNWKEISKSVATLLYFSNRFGRFIKQNNIHFPRFKKMRTSFQGFLNVEKEHLLLKAPPQLLFLFNAHESQEILHEAITLQIPVVALTDSSTDLSQITYPIPINSDSIRLVHMCLSQLIQMTDRQGNFSK